MSKYKSIYDSIIWLRRVYDSGHKTFFISQVSGYPGYYSRITRKLERIDYIRALQVEDRAILWKVDTEAINRSAMFYRNAWEAGAWNA